jgi:serine/threonine protein kinase/Tol biopolymer transport system component
MSPSAWNSLSDWYNEWLIAEPIERGALRAQFAIEHPDLVGMANVLLESSGSLPGFLETPALVLAAGDLARDEPLLGVNARLGPYRIVSLLARGGMGDVYRATDVRLGRDVALKVIASATEADPERVERFLQEARVTASLDHLNIVKVFDVGVSDGRPYIISELLDGETLRARLNRGPIGLEEVRGVAAGIASGLVAAHAAGLVHRDLKPDNIVLTRAGTTKVLDFGIAKLVDDKRLTRGVSTLTGILLGTAGYLAPEQVRGESVDGRADLFAIGSILFELLAGRRAFARDHTVDTLHAIVHDDPGPLPLEVPPPLAAIVTRLLAKSPDARFQSAADLLWTLDQLAPIARRLEVLPSVPLTTAAAVQSAARRRVPDTVRWLLWAAPAAAVILVAAIGWSRGGSSPVESLVMPVTRFTWSAPSGMTLASAPVVSPDGRSVAFVARDTSGTRLLVRPLDALEATAINGTEGAKQPFWSPDGRSIGFFANGKLQRVSLASGAPVVLCDAPDGRGGSWGPDGTIVFAANLIFSGLSKVSADGGVVEAATLLDPDREDAHRWPVFLPDGVHFIFHIRSSNDERRGVYVGRADRPASRPGALLFRSETQAALVTGESDSSSLLLSAVGNQIEVRHLDTTALTIVGHPRSLPVPAAAMTPYVEAMVSASPEVLASVGMAVPFGAQLGSVTREGTDVRLSPRQQQNFLRLSPDGHRLARQILDPLRGTPDIWVENLDDGSLVRITTDLGSHIQPVWSPDGQRLAYGNGTLTARRLSIAAADGTGTLLDVPCPAPYCEPTDWTRDGRQLIVSTGDIFGVPRDIWVVSSESDGSATALLAGSYTERDGRLSPDGRWIAYASEETGRREVSVQTMAGSRRRVAVSSGGGSQPVWRHDGRELFYVDLAGHLRSRSVQAGVDGGLTLGPVTAINIPFISPGHWGTNYDVSPDGGRIYFLSLAIDPGPRDIALVLGWRAMLR